MRKTLSILTLITIILFAISALAQNKTVVIPLNLSGASTSSGTNLVKDSDGSVIGKVVGVDSRDRWTTINTKNYLVAVDAAGWPKGETVYFSGAGCSGTPMIVLTTSGSPVPSFSKPIHAKQGYVFTEGILSAIWYIAPGTAVSSGQAYQSRFLTSGCQATAGTATGFLATINDENVTGVPKGGYGNVSLQEHRAIT